MGKHYIFDPPYAPPQTILPYGLYLPTLITIFRVWPKLKLAFLRLCWTKQFVEEHQILTSNLKTESLINPKTLTNLKTLSP